MLRDVVEKVFGYPESKLRKCTISTAGTSQLVRLEEEALKKAMEAILSSGGWEVVVNEFDFREKPRRVTLKRGEGYILRLGKGNELSSGTYIAKIYWERGEKKGVIRLRRA